MNENPEIVEILQSLRNVLVKNAKRELGPIKLRRFIARRLQFELSQRINPFKGTTEGYNVFVETKDAAFYGDQKRFMDEMIWYELSSVLNLQK